MTITCDTPIENLLNVEEVKVQTDEYVNTVTQATESLLTTITSEQAKGLSPDAFVIDGDSLIYEKAQTIKTNLSSIEDELNNWKNNIITKAEEKRKEELSQLILAVNTKLLDLSTEIARLNITKIINKDASAIERLEEVSREYKHYKEKNDQMIGMKE